MNASRSGIAEPLLLALCCAAQFMVVLDVSVVNVAVPSVQADLGFDAADLQWVVNGYALVFAGFLLLGGRLADLFGRRRMVVLGLALFSSASLAGGLADAPGALVAARAAQGLGAAILAPATLAVLTTTFPEGPRRVRALAVWTALGVGGGTAGNLIGGALTEYLSWRWVLLVNVPLGVLAILLAVLVLPAEPRRPQRAHRLDLPGAVLVTCGLLTLTYGIARTREHGWGEPATVAVLICGTILLAAFVVVEAGISPAPLLPLRLVRLPAIAVGNVVLLLTGACLVPMWYFLSLTMQRVLAFDAMRTGLGFLPHTLVTILVGTLIAPGLLRHVDGRILVSAGGIVAAFGFLWQSTISTGSDYLSGILGPALLMSAGTGLLTTPITATVTSGVPDSEAGAAAGLMNTTKQIGGALGLAVLATIAGGTVSDPPDPADGYRLAFRIIAGVLILSAAVALMLPRTRDPTATPRLGRSSPAGRRHRWARDRIPR